MSGRSRKGCRGSTLIEFAVVLLPLLAVIFGAIEMDRMVLAYTSLSNAARTGVRYAIVHGQYADGSAVSETTKNNIGQLVRNVASTGMIDSSRMTISMTCTNTDNPDDAYVNICYRDKGGSAFASGEELAKVGYNVSVTVRYPFEPFTGFFPLSVGLSSTAKGVIAF